MALEITSKNLDNLNQQQFDNLIQQLESGITNIMYNGTKVALHKANEFVGKLIDIYFDRFIAKKQIDPSKRLSAY